MAVIVLSREIESLYLCLLSKAWILTISSIDFRTFCMYDYRFLQTLRFFILDLLTECNSCDLDFSKTEYFLS